MPEFWITLFEQLKESKVALLILVGAGMFLVIGGLAALSHCYTLSGIKSRTVGDGQHGTARWATAKEIKRIYAHVPFRVREWRSGHNRPAEQGLVLGCKGKKGELTALVDSDDIHCLMIGASGIGKTAYFLYPNLEYACASGMSWLALDSKGDLARNYGTSCQGVLWIQCLRHRPAKSHPLGWQQSADAGQPIHGHCPKGAEESGGSRKIRKIR